MSSLIDELRQYRDPVFGTSLFDTGGTIVIGYYLANRLNTPKVPTIAGLFVVGHLVHKAMNIQTTFSKSSEDKESLEKNKVETKIINNYLTKNK
jgi:mannose/fructose/N-acetylgalactosamine-specific phosphotransferase system component IID